MMKNSYCTNIHHIVTSIFIALVIFHCSSSVSKAETRHHESHVHGVGALNIAQDGKTFFIELSSPTANIVGFEHAPKNEEQEEALHQAIDLLQKGEELFIFPANAQCALQDVLFEEDDHHDQHGDHDEDGEHDKHNENHHDDDGEHSDVEITYQFSCNQPEAVKNIDVKLFSNFPGFEEIEVQLITPTQQTALELTPSNHTIAL